MIPSFLTCIASPYNTEEERESKIPNKLWYNAKMPSILNASKFPSCQNVRENVFRIDKRWHLLVHKQALYLHALVSLLFCFFNPPVNSENVYRPGNNE